MTTVRFARTVTFSCAHRYFDPLLDEEANRRMYGTYYRAEGFGHNYLLEAHFEGEIDAQTGMIINLNEVDHWLKEIASVLDHKHLNELPQFKGVSPTPERIVQWFYGELEQRVSAHVSTLRSQGDKRAVSLAKVRLHEGDSLWVDYGR